MKKITCKSNAAIGIAEGLGFVLSFALFVFFFAPALSKMIDDHRYEQDQFRAEQLTLLIQREGRIFNQPVDAHEIRQYIYQNSSKPNVLKPQTRHGAFFYDVDKGTIVSLRYDDLMELSSTAVYDPFSSPEELFSDGWLLLSEEGNRLAEDICHITALASGSRYQTAWLTESIKRLERQLEQNIDRFLFQEEDTAAWKQRHRALLDYYHPTKVLYVNNLHWFTAATDSDAINSIIFEPGISHIPPFELTRFSTASIQLERVVLPKTVRSISKNAFSSVFDIHYLEGLDPMNLRVEEDALVGVRHIDWRPDTHPFDDPRYIIDDQFEGRPLILYTLTEVRETLSLDLRHVKRYFQYLGIEVIHYNISLNVFDMTQTKVYIYTHEGYYGYIVPEPN